MSQSQSLALIDRICSVYEEAENEDAGLAAEIMRVIRAVAVKGRVTLLADGPAAELLKAKMPQERGLWAVVSIADDSVPESAH
jgi:hypothetical protein